MAKVALWRHYLRELPLKPVGLRGSHKELFWSFQRVP
jgi:hypothetical protein